MGLGSDIIALVHRETRLEGIKKRWGTTKQAAFLMSRAAEHEGRRRVEKARKMKGDAFTATEEVDTMQHALEMADPEVYTAEDQRYQNAFEQLNFELNLGQPVLDIDRELLPTFDFRRCLAVVVVGPDGLVANTAKYARGLPIIGVNPDPKTIDGILLPFRVDQARNALRRVLDDRATIQEATLAQVSTSDGQEMFAFNDFFAGMRGHASARYMLDTKSHREQQSSSGVIVSTGAGSTGWLSSIANMTSGISQHFGGPSFEPTHLARDERRLMWAVREPFRSKDTGVDHVIGTIEEGEELTLASQMPGGGVIFSDGIESDFLEFNTGVIARFAIAEERAQLVVA